MKRGPINDLCDESGMCTGESKPVPNAGVHVGAPKDTAY